MIVVGLRVVVTATTIAIALFACMILISILPVSQVSAFVVPRQLSAPYTPQQHHWHVLSAAPTPVDVLPNDNNNTDKDDSDDGDDNPELVSDAEALLACWAYLQRHKRLGNWTAMEERRSQRTLQKGFFLWDQVYDEVQHSQSILDGTDDVNDNHNNHNYNDKNNDDSTTRIWNQRQDEETEMGGGATMYEQSSFSTYENTGRDDGRGNQFTSFPSGPTSRWITRSKAIKKVWDDPAFRERWYERRWGSSSGDDAGRNRTKDTPTPQMIRQQRAERRARELPADFLGSEELASMTEAEIAEAIRIRVKSSQARIDRIRQTRQDRQRLLIEQQETLIGNSNSNSTNDGRAATATTITTNAASSSSWPVMPPIRSTRDPFVSPMDEDLRAKQEKRSKQAKRLYAKRLQNQQEQDNENPDSAKQRRRRPPPPPRPPRFPPKDMTPQNALLRIEHALDLDQIPNLDDVEFLVQAKVGGRRPIFQRILREAFDLRGKCVPQDDGQLGFLTHSKIDALGRFVMDLIRSRNKTKEEGGV